jgi:hypothetical protein
MTPEMSVCITLKLKALSDGVVRKNRRLNVVRVSFGRKKSADLVSAWANFELALTIPHFGNDCKSGIELFRSQGGSDL